MLFILLLCYSHFCFCFSYLYHIFIFHLYQIANKWYPKNKSLLPETQLYEHVYFSYFFQWFLKNEFYIEPKKKPLKLEYITRSRASACSLKSIDLVGIWRDRYEKIDPPILVIPEKWTPLGRKMTILNSLYMMLLWLYMMYIIKKRIFKVIGIAH